MKHIQINMHQHGFTIVEAMITFLILSVGLLGMAGLQTKGLQMGQNSYQRSQAAMFAQDIAERMRANVDETVDNVTYKIGVDESAATDQNCVLNTCTPAQLAEFDLAQWKDNVATALPNGKAGVNIASDGNSAAITVTIYWDEYRNGATVGECPPQSETDMACFQVNSTLAKAP